MNAILFHPRCWLLLLAVFLFVPLSLRAQAAKIIHPDDVVYRQVHGAGLLADIAHPESIDEVIEKSRAFIKEQSP